MTEPVARFRVGRTAVWELDGVLFFTSGFAIDVDGAANAYHPPTAARPNSGRPPGLDDIRNAGRPEIRLVDGVKVPWYGVGPRRGDLVAPAAWWGLATDDGKPSGVPAIQVEGDPFPGHYVSTTALGDLRFKSTDPRRYVDSMTVPYISLPGGLFHGLYEPGDLALVIGPAAAPAWTSAIYADVGPANKIGEVSPATATALGLFRGVDVGHDAADIVTILLPGTRTAPRLPRSHDDMHAATLAAFTKWGGNDRLHEQFPFLAVKVIA